MAQFTTISQSLYDEKSKVALNKTPIRKEVSLKDVEIIKSDTLKLGDQQIRMNKDAFKSICKAVGLPIGFDKTFTTAFGDKARQQLVNRLKTAVQAKGNTTISLVVNPHTREIISIQSDVRDLVSNQTFLDTTGKIINKYGLDVTDFSVSYDGGVVINAASPKNAWGIQGLKDEEFYGGISFTNSPNDGFMVSPFLHRLVCANGMVGKTFIESMSLGSIEPLGMENFWTRLNQLAERGFRPSQFEDRIRLAMNTKASLYELENAHEALRSFSDAEAKELEAWIPYHTTRAKFHEIGVDTVTLSTPQKKGAKSGTTVWDMINGITHFATHDNGFKIDDYDRRRLQVKASHMLTKDFDMANVIVSPF
jgi:hypothetical protein